MKLKKPDYILILVVVLTTFLSVIFANKTDSHYNLKQISISAQKNFIEKEIGGKEILDAMVQDFEEKGKGFLLVSDHIIRLNELYDDEGVVVLITEGDSIRYLSHNSLPVNHNRLPRYSSGIVLLDNGWYYVDSDHTDDVTIWVFSLIKKNYRYKNKFLNNSFASELDIPEAFDISDDSADDGFPIYNSHDDFAFSLIIPDGESAMYENNLYWLFSVLLCIIALVILLYLIYSKFSYLYNKGHPGLSVLGLFLSFLLLRFLMFYFQQPFVFYEGELFSARHFAASYLLPSLGDLFLNFLFGGLFSFFIFTKVSSDTFQVLLDHTISRLGRNSIIVVSAVLLIFLALSALIVLQTLTGLVINSSLGFNVKFIIDPDIYHIVGFLILTGIFLFYYFISFAFLKFIKHTILTVPKGSTIFIIYILVIIVVAFILIKAYYLLWLSIFLASFLSLFNSKEPSHEFSLSRLLLSFLVFAIISTYGLFLVNNKKELATRQNVSLRIASEQDPVAEFLFSEIEPSLSDDFVLTNMILADSLNETSVLEYLKAEYFNDFWAKYDIQITVCAPGELIIYPPNDEEMVCDEFFLMYAENFGKKTLSESFLYLDNNTGRNAYLAIIPIKRNRERNIAFHLYIEFVSRFIPKELGFPELLVDEKIDITRNLGNYSYAIYKNGLLTNKYGSYFYNINVDSYGKTNTEPFVLFEADNYSHILYHRDHETSIIVSLPRETLLEKIAPFSYLFIFYCFYALIVWISMNYRRFGFNFSFNFKKRLQATIIGIVLISVVAIGSASAWFIFNIYKNKNEAFVNEKAHSVLIEMENSLVQEPFLDESYSEFLDLLLLKLSHVFFTDINVFHPSGSLLASSRSKVFNEGLIAPIIDPVAYNNLKIKGKSLFIHNERIGNLEYISAYVQLRNFDGDLIAYINLPYFAQQSELRNEISFFLVAFINIYLLLLLLSVVIAYFISNHVTKPLQIIRDSFSRLSIGKTNEKIDWKRDDEIGHLITEYNRMISELEISAELLARSERESAWREMAKQVAHEIKNPLTPMRLNVQYLQRAWNDKVDDWDERLERFTKAMVEQIDNLSLIAGEFSDFAKMPAANNDVINLGEFIPEIPDLYKGYDEVDISFHFPEHGKPLVIYADRKQLLRVFNNLIKNSMQAYSRNERARIDIICRSDGKYSVIEIRDFGAGIAEDLRKNIFQPYFTTKTAGMGLGLAMVKSIIESFSGHISFESETGKGTAFIIRIPLLR
jgi:two-component system, NtrC family, nitrogen regulation sensor histidine kinase NtrY